MTGLLSAEACAALADVSLATWYRIVARGHAPASVKIGRACVRWKADEIKEWVEEGCPIDWQKRAKVSR